MEGQGAKLQLFPGQSFISLGLGQQTGLGTEGTQLPYLPGHSFSTGTDCLFPMQCPGLGCQEQGTATNEMGEMECLPGRLFPMGKELQKLGWGMEHCCV